MTVLDELQEAARRVAAMAGPVTVAIGRHGRGSGVVVAAGRVVTNAHNLRDRTTQVTFADGRAVQASLLGADVDEDLVVLDVDTGDVTPLGWADRPVEPGDAVFAVAAGGGVARVTFGLVSAVGRRFRGPRGRRVTGSVEHTAPLARGSSGGPLVDGEGRLVGLNTHRVGDGFYLALTGGEELRARITRLAAGESVTRKTLGVALAPPHVAARLRRAVGLPPRNGLLVRRVEDGSPAALAGVAEGDLLVRADGRELTEADDLLDVLDAAGESLTLGIVRGVDELEIVVTFVTGNADDATDDTATDDTATDDTNRDDTNGDDTNGDDTDGDDA
jgi:serine protease Do